MRPGAERVIEAAVVTLTEVADRTGRPEEAARIRGVVRVLGLLQSEWDTAAAARVAVIGHYREVLAKGAELVDEPQLRARLAGCIALVERRKDDLLISSLEACLDLLRAAVTDLHCWLEVQQSPEAGRLLEEVWGAEHEDAKSRGGVEYRY